MSTFVTWLLRYCHQSGHMLHICRRLAGRQADQSISRLVRLLKFTFYVTNVVLLKSRITLFCICYCLQNGRHGRAYATYVDRWRVDRPISQSADRQDFEPPGGWLAARLGGPPAGGPPRRTKAPAKRQGDQPGALQGGRHSGLND